MVRAPEPDKIPINSPHDLSLEVDALVIALQLNETEDTWEKINRAVKRFQAVVRGGACRFTDDFVHHLRDPRVVKGLVRSLVTERTALSGTALELVASCTRLGHHFAALLSLYLPTLLRLFARPNKVYVTRSASCVASIIRNTRIADVVRFVALEWRNEPGKSATFREQAAVALAIALGADTDTLGVDKEGLERRIDDVEWLIKNGATGREASVRAEMKKCWEVYKREWPDRVASFTAPMTPTIRKYLKVTDAIPGGASSSTASRPPPRKPAPALGASAGPAPHHASTRSTAPALSKSHGPPSMAVSYGPSRSTVSHSTSSAAPRSHTLAASTSTLTADSLGHGPAPSLRAARVDHSRTASASTMPSSSRSASRCDERDQLAASTSSARSGLAAVGAPVRSGFKPTAPGAGGAPSTSAPATAATSKAGPLGGAARPAIRSMPSTASTTSATAEPRKARRVAPPAPPAAAAVEPTPTGAAGPPARAQTLARSTGPGGSSAAPLAASTSAAQHKPFRPKLNASVAAAANPLATSAKPRAARAPAPVPPAVPTTSAPPASSSTSAPAPAAPPAPAAAAAAAPRPPRAAAAATAGTASSRAASAGAARTAPSAATLASRERRAAREAARMAAADKDSAKLEAAAAAAREEKDQEERRRTRERECEREEEERQRVRAEEASRVAVQREERERAEREQERARAVPLPVEEDVQEAAEEEPAAAPTEVEQHAQDEELVEDAAAELDVEDERGMHSEMVLAESQATDAALGPALSPGHTHAVEQPVHVEELVFVEQVQRADTPLQHDADVEEPSSSEDEEPAPELDVVQAELADASVTVDAAPTPKALERVEAPASPIVAADQNDEPAQVDHEAALVHDEPLHDGGDGATAGDERSAPSPAVAHAPLPVASPVRARAPSYDALPPSPLLASAESAEHVDEASEAEGEAAVHDRIESPSRDKVGRPSSAGARTPGRHEEQSAVHAFATDSAPPTPFLAVANSPAPTSTPAPVTRSALPHTPATATPARPAVRFPAPTLQYSPEPWQTASIMLDTPPRLDALPGMVRLPGARVALPLAAAAPTVGYEASDDDADGDEHDVLPASPLASKTASPSPGPRSERPQAVFLDDYKPASPHDDVDSTFEAEQSVDSVDAEAEEASDNPSLARTERGAEPSPAAADDVRSASYESSRLYSIPLHDTSTPNYTVRSPSPSPATDDNSETEYDDSSVDEAQASAETTRMGRSPVQSAVEEPAEEIVASTSGSTAVATTTGADTEDPFHASTASPASPNNSSTTQDFSFFGAPVSSTPSSRMGALAAPNPWDMSLLGDESACFELERTQLRFHDETESEHEASMASTARALADVEVDVEPRGAARSATPPGVLQRSLRNRVVTVDLQTPGAASKPLTRSTRSAARGVLNELH